MKPAAATLKTIVDAIEDDFGVTISKDIAKEIKEAARKNCLVWDATKLVTLDSSQIKIRRAGDHVEANVDFVPVRAH